MNVAEGDPWLRMVKLGLPLKLVRREYISTRIDIDVTITLLDHGYDDLEGFDSAEFVLNHSQRISVVTGTSSVYGVLEETHLTSTHPFNIPKPGITLGNVQEKP